jgi:phosphatidylserine decarboxylase
VEDVHGRQVLFRQIAGAMARRIVKYAEQGNEAEQSTEFGFIKFGSRVDIFLPIGTQIDVVLNQVVTGSITQLATLK